MTPKLLRQGGLGAREPPPRGLLVPRSHDLAGAAPGCALWAWRPPRIALFLLHGDEVVAWFGFVSFGAVSCVTASTSFMHAFQEKLRLPPPLPGLPLRLLLQGTSWKHRWTF